MVAIEDAAQAFPEVEIEQLNRIFQHYESPSLAQIAEVLEQAKAKGKVPDSDYRGRVENPIPAGERQLHPEIKREIEKAGFDPAEAERGLEAEEEADRGEWEQEAIEVANEGNIEDLVDLYVRLNDLATDVLKSPTRSDIPDDIEVGFAIISNELESRIDQAGLTGDPDRIKAVQQQLHRVPADEVREAYLDQMRGWSRLAHNDGSEVREASEWVFDAADGSEAAERIAELKEGEVYDITTEQLTDIIEEAKQKFAGAAEA